MKLLLAGLMGALLTLLVILGDAPRWYERVYGSHVGKPDFYLWVLLISGQIGLSFALAVPTLEIVRPLFRDSNRKRRVLAQGALISLIVVGFVLSTTLFLAPDFHIKIGLLTTRVLVLNFVSFGVVLVGAIGGWLIYFALEVDFACNSKKATITNFAELRVKLNTLLWVVGLILGASIIAMAGLRNAIIAYNKRSSAFPGQYLFIYGAFFSALLALAYLPIHARALSVGRSLRDRLLPIPDQGNVTSVGEWNANRKALEDALSFDLSGNSSARTALAILTPLAGSLIGLLLQR
jgi:hypothetical protein